MPAEPSTPGRSLLGRLLTLLGLSGFAISQPLLAIAGDDPTLFTFAGVEGTGLVAFALLVALVPPLAGWAVVAALGRLHPRAGDVAYWVLVALLGAAAAAQWAWSAGLDHRMARMGLALVAGVALAALIARVAVVAEWARYTAVLPALSVLLLLVASPSSALLTSPEDADPVADSRLPSVVFILLDELPLESLLADDGTIDAVRFPNLAAFAAESTWYRNYTVLANGTLQSVPSILTGREPTGDGPLWTQHPDNLFSLLAPTHDLTVSETATQLCGYANCGLEGAEHEVDRGITSVLSQLADVWQQRVGLQRRRGPDLGQFADELVPLDPGEARRPGESQGEDQLVARPAAVADFIDALETDRSPSLDFLHVMLPHQPWERTPEGEPMVSLNGFSTAVFGGQVDEWELAVLEQAHLFQLEYTDRLVGDILDRLRELDRYDDSLVVITSDHGVDFDDSVLRSLDEGTIPDIAYVPLFLKSPGQTAGEVDDVNIDARDLVPTIADVLGIEVPWDHDGLPASSPAVADRSGRKVILDFGDDFGRTPLETLEFDTAEHQPSADRRRVGNVGPDDHPLTGLLRPIGADGWLGADADGLATSTGTGGATSLHVADQEGEDGALVAGRLVARLDATAIGDGDGLVLLAVDGVVETASPVLGDGRAVLFVPPHAAGGHPELRLFRVQGDDIVELEVDVA